MNDNNKHNNKNDGPCHGLLALLFLLLCTTVNSRMIVISSSLCAVVVVVVFVIIGTHASLMMDTFADSCAWCKL